MLPGHPALKAVGGALADVLSAMFFASMETEEGLHHTLRVVLSSSAGAEEGAARSLPFRQACSCTPRNLLRLARAAHSERLLITVGVDRGAIAITGLARESFDERSQLLKIRAPAPGCLEIWNGPRRLVEYAHGSIQTPPEDLLLSSGQVREKLLQFAADVQAPPGYMQTISSLVHHLSDHPHGGILVLSAEDDPYIPSENSFALGPDKHLWNALCEFGSASSALWTGQESASDQLRKEALRAEIERVVSEIGHMTALDGATILDRHLAVRGFGIVLPVSSDVKVVEVLDAAATMRRAFPLGQYGARHRAAASYAARRPGSLVFIASSSGDIGCLLQESDSGQVLLWRFRAGDLSSASL